MKTQTRVDIKGNDLQLHLDDNRLVTFKGITDTKQIPEYMITNLNYLIDSFYIDSQVLIEVAKIKNAWDIHLCSSNVLLSNISIFYWNDTKESKLSGNVNGYFVSESFESRRTYKQIIKGLKTHVTSIL